MHISRTETHLGVSHVLAKLPVHGVDVVDAGVAHEGDVPEEVATNKGVVPVKLILYQVHQTVVITILTKK